eukprot:CAMPEP_0181273120 /NCGR_PEP_ID=MMETSP1097-20121128/8437_1 /TAXON_ID=35684 /ORGANISM="Pseudopedinella elastica, Strain CCMP716" /LENGTH=56 /DNA_ID=CAMNT_0023373939 /DNA_START=40 /DNA_END=210 /DNA_ORIENTATION=-
MWGGTSPSSASLLANAAEACLTAWTRASRASQSLEFRNLFFRTVEAALASTPGLVA